MIATAIRQIFKADTGDEARERLAEVVDRVKAPAPKVAGLLEHAPKRNCSRSTPSRASTGPS